MRHMDKQLTTLQLMKQTRLSHRKDPVRNNKRTILQKEYSLVSFETKMTTAVISTLSSEMS
jgi:hypothetical protein